MTKESHDAMNNSYLPEKQQKLHQEITGMSVSETKVESVGLDKDILCEPFKVSDKSLLNEEDVQSNSICEMKIVLQSKEDIHKDTITNLVTENKGTSQHWKISL